MMIRKLTFGILVVLLMFGCGYLSNALLWEGHGRVTGRIVAEGNPLEGVLVFILGEPDRMTVTDADGAFDILVKAGEERHLIALWGISLGLVHSFSLAGEGSRDFSDLELSPVGFIEGTVSISYPERAEVTIEGTPFVGRLSEDGEYRIVLPAGEWDLEVQAEGYLKEGVDALPIQSGQTKNIQTISLSVDPDYTCEGSEARSDLFNQGGQGEVDILFVMDNSGSMVGEQLALATSFGNFTVALEDASVDYHIAVVTPGMESTGCPPCSSIPVENPPSCMNATGESGRFQDRLGHNQGTEDDPDFDFETDPACRVVDRNNLECVYDQVEDRGTILVGINGCGYERGLAGMRTALDDLADTYNKDFLRPWARLAVIVVSDEDDCGEVGDINEGAEYGGGDACYYAAKGVDPEGNPEDPEGKPYALTSVEEYAAFLRNLKISPALVSFSAIVGVTDPADPDSTSIEYEWDGARWQVSNACATPGCTGVYCNAQPGTRYIEMAQRLNGMVDTICQEDFSEPMLNVAGASTGYTRIFKLSADPTSADTVEVLVNRELVTSGYRFDPEIRTVVFDQNSTPSPYSLVEIRYEVACE